jgi:hypothetical protein
VAVVRGGEGGADGGGGLHGGLIGELDEGKVGEGCDSGFGEEC